MNKLITRTCIATRKRFNKSELIRIGIDQSIVRIDAKNLLQSRGVYISPSIENLEKAILSGSISRVLKINRKLSESEVSDLRKELIHFLNEEKD